MSKAAWGRSTWRSSKAVSGALLSPSRLGVRRIHMGDTPINVAYPAAEDLHLRIALGACRFKARPGEDDAWVAGTYHDPTDRRPPRILEEGASVTITEEEPSFERIPAVFGGVPRYELRLCKQRLFALTIATAANDFGLDLGGVPLSGLMVRQGAGNSCLKSARG